MWVFFIDWWYCKWGSGEKVPANIIFRKLMPLYLQRQSRWDSSDTEEEGPTSGHVLSAKLLFKCISGFKLNYPNDCETVLQPRRHSWRRHWPSTAALHLRFRVKGTSCGISEDHIIRWLMSYFWCKQVKTNVFWNKFLAAVMKKARKKRRALQMHMWKPA